ncbi:MAG TPA: hypothetical protein VM639_21835 [Dongiaceae bacterium]|nr:hypothetical protein [Dongiaceae bacterium]
MKGSDCFTLNGRGRLSFVSAKYGRNDGTEATDNIQPAGDEVATSTRGARFAGHIPEAATRLLDRASFVFSKAVS